ncbi:MAG: hypothetical protein QXN45_03065 [Candidatus Thermoplasmatota archaeon]
MRRSLVLLVSFLVLISFIGCIQQEKPAEQQQPQEEHEQWTAYNFENVVKPATGNEGKIKSFSVIETYVEEDEIRKFEINSTYMGKENTEIKVRRMEIDIPTYNFIERNISVWMECYKIKHRIRVVQAPEDEHPDWCEIIAWIPTSKIEAIGTYLWICPKAEYLDSRGNFGKWSYYMNESMQDEMSNPPHGKMISYSPYTEGNFYGFDIWALYGWYGWAWAWFGLFAKGGKYYLEEGSFTYTYGGAIYSYVCSSTVKNVGSYKFKAWEIKIRSSYGGETAEYKGIFSPSLPIPIYLKIGGRGEGKYYWEYELVDIKLG